MTEKLPELVAELAAQPVDEMVLDGELVALGEDGMPSFETLQQSMDLPRGGRAGRTPLYYPFDLVHLGRRDLKGLPLTDRKGLLERAVVPGDLVRLMEYVEGEGEAFYDGTLRMGLEGMVAKRARSVYEDGARSRSWLKIKRTRSGEFVVGGYTAGEGARSGTFGALVVGRYDGDRLTYSGRVGTGFDERTLKQVRGLLDGLEAAKSPFAEPVDDARAVTWTRPELVAELSFAQWTQDGRLRSPVFMRLRPDRNARSVMVETAEVVPPPVGEQGKGDSLDIDEVLAQLSEKRGSMILDVGGSRISLTNLDKVFWPAQDGRAAVTKRDMVRYYTRMANVIVPHLRDRPLTLTRYPDGILGQSFYQKRWST